MVRLSRRSSEQRAATDGVEISDGQLLASLPLGFIPTSVCRVLTNPGAPTRPLCNITCSLMCQPPDVLGRYSHMEPFAFQMQDSEASYLIHFFDASQLSFSECPLMISPNRKAWNHCDPSILPWNSQNGNKSK